MDAGEHALAHTDESYQPDAGKAETEDAEAMESVGSEDVGGVEGVFGAGLLNYAEIAE